MKIVCLILTVIFIITGNSYALRPPLLSKGKDAHTKGSLQELIAQRKRGVNIALPIIDPRVVLHDYNKAHPKEQYMPDQVINSGKVQYKIMKWLHRRDVLSLPMVYPSMNLTRFGGLVAKANNRGDVVTEAIAIDGTTQYAVNPFMTAEEIDTGKLVVPEDPSIYAPAQVPMEFIEQVNQDPELRGVPILVFVEGPYTLIGNILGIGDISSPNPEGLAFLTPAQIVKWLAFTEEVIKKQIDDLYKANIIRDQAGSIIGKANLKICLLEPTASAGKQFLRPALFEKYLLTVIDRIGQYAENKGMEAGLHSCGNTTKNFQAYAKFKHIKFISVDVEADKQGLLAVLPEDMVVGGNVDFKALAQATPEEVFKRTRGMGKATLVNSRICPMSGCQITSLGSENQLAKLQAFMAGADPMLPDAEMSLERALNITFPRTRTQM